MEKIGDNGNGQQHEAGQGSLQQLTASKDDDRDYDENDDDDNIPLAKLKNIFDDTMLDMTGFDDLDDVPLAELIQGSGQDSVLNLNSNNEDACNASPLPWLGEDKPCYQTCMDIFNDMIGESHELVSTADEGHHPQESHHDQVNLEPQDQNVHQDDDPSQLLDGNHDQPQTPIDNNAFDPSDVETMSIEDEDHSDLHVEERQDQVHLNPPDQSGHQDNDPSDLQDGNSVWNQPRTPIDDNASTGSDDGSSRKRHIHTEVWKRNMSKANRNKGLAYTSVGKGIEMPGRTIGKPCKGDCKMKCSVSFSDEERRSIFDHYWGCGNFERQRDYIACNVIHKDTTAKKRIHRCYYLCTEKKRARVCKTFFLTTLGIKEKTVTYTLRKKGKEVFVKSDRRGKHTKRKTPNETLQNIRDHISKFPCVESHYCRQTTKRRYLDSSLSVPKMYELYKGECMAQEAKFASLNVYRSVFNNEFNLGFHKPKKDQCATCTTFNALSKEEKEKQQYKQDEHLHRKERCREEKALDKIKAQTDPSFRSYTFDLQQVLQTPCSQISTLYYKRKLSSYNLTVYDQANHDGTCYLWNEDMGNRGSTEIGTCLLKHLWSLPESVNSVSLFSDCCGGQNRNQYVAGALSYAVKTIPHLNIIDQKFLESGHTQMEVDSMHSSIEYAKKHVPVYHPDNWIPVLRMARRKQPYKVVSLSFKDFVDLHHLSEVQFSNVKKEVTGEQVNWLKIKMLRFKKEQPNTILFKYNLDDEFRVIKVSVSGRRKSVETLKKEEKPAYEDVLPISEAKKKDLVSLCDTGIIPQCYHAYYRQMKAVSKQKDKEE